MRRDNVQSWRKEFSGGQKFRSAEAFPTTDAAAAFVARGCFCARPRLKTRRTSFNPRVIIRRIDSGMRSVSEEN